MLLALLLISSAQAAKIDCHSCGAGGSYQAYVDGVRPLGEWCYSSRAACDVAIRNAPSGMICSTGEDVDQQIPIRIDDQSPVGNFYFSSPGDCEQALKHAQGSLVCGNVDSENSTIAVFDANGGDLYEDGTLGSLKDCVARIAKLPREELLPINKAPARAVTGEVRLDGAGGAMEHVSVRDQDDLSDCFAMSAVELTDAWRFSHGDSNFAFQSSGIVAGGATQRAAGDAEFTDVGGFIQDVMKVISGKGVCRKDAVLDALNTGDQKKILEILKRWRAVSAEKGKETWLNSATLKQYGQDFSAVYSLACSAHDQMVMPELQQLRDILQTVDAPRLISSIVDKPCAKSDNQLHPKLPPLQRINVGLKTVAEISGKLSALLSGPKAQPVSVSLCANVLDKDKTFNGVLTDGSERDSCDHHQALIIGKRVNGRRTQFLLRNSWGTECGTAASMWGCDGKGSSWVDGDSLSSNVYEIAYFGEEK
jgi:hypothetical protein